DNGPTEPLPRLGLVHLLRPRAERPDDRLGQLLLRQRLLREQFQRGRACGGGRAKRKRAGRGQRGSRSEARRSDGRDRPRRLGALGAGKPPRSTPVGARVIRSAAAIVDFDLTPAGLFYAYDLRSGKARGRVVFVPRASLP